MPLVVAIVGRPNVGKSTLFNRLVGRRKAIVHDRPGVTRDWREEEGRIASLALRVRDTAGLDDRPRAATEATIQRQTETALANADAVLFLIDARAGVTALDRHFAAVLRRQPAPVVLVANKCEGAVGAALTEAFELGLGEAVPISAEHGLGLGDLYAALTPFEAIQGDDSGIDGGVRDADPPIRLAFVGRPNVGKSTLLNRILGEARMVTGPEPGITRDAILAETRHEGRRVQIVDTAGVRRRANVVESLEKLAVSGTLDAIAHAHVAALVLDASAPLERQDLAIARRVVDEGRALIIVANKWDLVADRGSMRRALADRLKQSLPQAEGAAICAVSASTGENVAAVMTDAVAAHETWCRRIPTAALNRWLADALAAHAPPSEKGVRPRFRYATQVKARPPTFALFVSRAELVGGHYRRYLENGLRRTFDLWGVPVRLMLRKGRNPYVSDRSGRS